MTQKTMQRTTQRMRMPTMMKMPERPLVVVSLGSSSVSSLLSSFSSVASSSVSSSSLLSRKGVFRLRVLVGSGFRTSRENLQVQGVNPETRNLFPASCRFMLAMVKFTLYLVPSNTWKKK